MYPMVKVRSAGVLEVASFGRSPLKRAEELVESLCTTGPIRTGLGTPSHVNVASPLKQAKRGLPSTPLSGPLKFLPYAAMRVRDQAFPLLPLHPRRYDEILIRLDFPAGSPCAQPN